MSQFHKTRSFVKSGEICYLLFIRFFPLVIFYNPSDASE